MVNEHRARAAARKAEQGRMAEQVRQEAQALEEKRRQHVMIDNTFVIDGRMVTCENDVLKQMYEQGFGYDGWWTAAQRSRLDDMLTGGFCTFGDGPYNFKILHSQRMSGFSLRLLVQIKQHNNVAAVQMFAEGEV